MDSDSPTVPITGITAPYLSKYRFFSFSVQTIAGIPIRDHCCTCCDDLTSIDMINNSQIDITNNEDTDIWSQSQQTGFCEHFINNFCFPPIIFGRPKFKITLNSTWLSKQNSKAVTFLSDGLEMRKCILGQEMLRALNSSVVPLISHVPRWSSEPRI